MKNFQAIEEEELLTEKKKIPVNQVVLNLKMYKKRNKFAIKLKNKKLETWLEKVKKMQKFQKLKEKSFRWQNNRNLCRFLQRTNNS